MLWGGLDWEDCAHIRIDDDDQCEAREMVALRHHLRTDEDIDRSRLNLRPCLRRDRFVGGKHREFRRIVIGA